VIKIIFSQRNLGWYLLLYFLFTFIGTKPYWQDGQHVADGDIDPIRQIFILTIFMATLCILSFDNTINKVLSFLKRNFALTALVFFSIISITWSEHPEFSVRRIFVYLTLFGFLLAVYVKVGAHKLYDSLKYSLVIVLAINTVSYVALGSISYDHEGLFKGIHVHKNTAGAVFSVTAILFAFDKFWPWYSRLVVLSLSSYFLVLSGSKTSLGLVLFSLSVCFFVKFYSRFSRVALKTTVALGAVFLACYMIFVGLDNFFYYVGDAYGDRTFTGRQTIWDFSLYFIHERPLLGWGYGAFWGVGLESNNIFYSDGFIENYGQSHNGYLDVALQLGLSGLLIVFLLFIKSLCASFYQLLGNSRNYIDSVAFTFFMFFVLHNLLESTLLLPLSILWPVFLAFYFIHFGDHHDSQR